MAFKFKVLNGSFVYDGKKYRRGDIIETEIDLSRVFKLTLQRIYEEPAAPPAPKAKLSALSVPPPPPVKEAVEVKPTPKAKPLLGDDVTDLFPAAEKEGKIVRYKDDLYFVYDARSPEVALHPEGVKKSKVNELIRKL